MAGDLVIWITIHLWCIYCIDFLFQVLLILEVYVNAKCKGDQLIMICCCVPECLAELSEKVISEKSEVKCEMKRTKKQNKTWPHTCP